MTYDVINRDEAMLNLIINGAMLLGTVILAFSQHLVTYGMWSHSPITNRCTQSSKKVPNHFSYHSLY